MYRLRPGFWAALCLWAMAASASVVAQTATGIILGTVHDGQGAAVPGVAVTATNVDTGLASSVVTDSAGAYTLPQLPAGRYNVVAELDGFAKSGVDGFVLQVAQNARLNIELKVGGLSETVTVVSRPTLLDSTSSSVGKVVDNRRIQDLPLNTRNVYGLINLTPGVAGTIGSSYNSLSYSVNGVRTGAMETLIDGSAGGFPTVNGASGISVFPSVDAVQEFKVQGSSYSAEYGRSLGSILNLVYKSGTNDLHGTAYEFYRDSAFDANNFFANANGTKLADFQRNQFGGMIGGPIAKNKLFYMVSFEGLRQDAYAELRTTVPSLLERQGDFSQTRAANGQPIVIYDPSTTRPNPNGSGFIRDPFPNNRIPAGRIDPVSLNVLKLYPLPNQAGDAVTGVNNYYSTGVQTNNSDNIDVRVDYNISASQRLFGRYSFRRALDIPADGFPSDLAFAAGRHDLNDHGTNAVLDYSNTMTAKTIFNARLAFARDRFLYANRGLGFIPSSLGLPTSLDNAVDRPMVPRFAVGGMVDLGGDDHRQSGFNTYSLSANVSRVAGRHYLKAGYEGRMIRINVWEARDAGNFTFNDVFTRQNPSVQNNNSGYGFASFLLGYGSSGLVYQNWKNVASNSFYHAFYLQDDWRATDRLTLNVGLRYDFDTPRTERYDRMSWFDPDAASPLSVVPGYGDLKGGLQFVGVDGNGRSQYDGDWNNFAPRLGLAYELTAKTVLRANVGRFYAASTLAAQGTVGPYGFRTETAWLSTLDGGRTPLNTLSNPYPQGFPPVPGSSAGLMTSVGGNIQAPLSDTTVPNTWQWNFTLQQELPWQIVAEAAYVGNRGRDLSLGGESGYNINQLDPQYLALGDALNNQVPNPFYGYVSTGLLSQPTVARSQLLRPYPQFADINVLFASGAESSYDALQTTLSKRFSNRLAFESNFTWSKSMDWGSTHVNSFDPANDKSVTPDVHIPYRFVFSGLYRLPIGRGEAWGGGMPRLLDALVGDWQINGIWTVQAGATLGIGASNSGLLGSQSNRANWNGGDPVIDKDAREKLDKWFDTTVFSQPGAFSFGNSSPRIAPLRAHHENNVDLSLLKDVRIAGGLRMQLRAEAFNAFNRVRFGNPNTTVTDRNFGRVTSQANTPRQLQFGVKLLW
jgi:hypothetical protein